MFNKLTKDGVNKYTAGTDAPSGKVGIIANADEIGIFIWCEDDIDLYGMVNDVWAVIDHNFSPDSKTKAINWSDYQAIFAMSKTGQPVVVRMIPILDSVVTIFNKKQLKHKVTTKFFQSA